MSGDKVEHELPPWAMVPEWLLDAETVSDGAVRLYGLLARIAGEKRVGWPSRATLAKRCRCSVATIDRRVKELADVGSITITHRLDDLGDPTSNLYRVLVIKRGGGVTDAATPTHAREEGGSTGEGTGSRVGDAQNESHSERESRNEDGAPPEQEKLIDVPVKERPRNPVYDALASVYPSATKSEASLIGMVAAELRKLKPVPDAETIVRRARWALREWPGSTPRAVATHWSAIGDRLRNERDPDEAPVDPYAGMDKRGGRQ